MFNCANVHTNRLCSKSQKWQFFIFNWSRKIFLNSFFCYLIENSHLCKKKNSLAFVIKQYLQVATMPLNVCIRWRKLWSLELFSRFNSLLRNFKKCLLRFVDFQETKCQVPFCYNLKNKLKQLEKQHRLQRSLLTRRRMAIMESTSSNMSSSSQAAPNTPGAPPTPQQDQPATPIHQYNMPGTSGQSANFRTPNVSPGKIVSMYSPHPGKGTTQQPSSQQEATSICEN